ncbi:MAG: hypothetical protein ACOC3V_04130 [bacterium]
MIPMFTYNSGLWCRNKNEWEKDPYYHKDSTIVWANTLTPIFEKTHPEIEEVIQMVTYLDGEKLNTTNGIQLGYERASIGRKVMVKLYEFGDNYSIISKVNEKWKLENKIKTNYVLAFDQALKTHYNLIKNN